MKVNINFQVFPVQYNNVASDGFDGDFIASVGRQDDKPLMDNITQQWKALQNEAAEIEVVDLPIIGVPNPTHVQMFSDFFRSDHKNFWNANMTAVFLTDTGLYVMFYLCTTISIPHVE